MLKMVGDFETTVDPEDARVWAWCLVDIDKEEVMSLGNSIDTFFEYIDNMTGEIYFHNLKFDGEWLLVYLLSHGWEHSDTRTDKTFETLITEDGVFYSITIYYKRLKKRYVKITFYCSLKKLPFSVARIAESFRLPETKGEIDYKKFRPIGYEMDDNEREYIINDCMIVARALKIQFDTGLTRMTIGSDALNGYKQVISRVRFEHWFPVLPYDVDHDFRPAYKGGFTYLNPKYKGKELQGCTFDVNSLYPSVMYDEELPYGYPILFEGQYQEEDFFPLYIQRLRCEFKVKKNHLPTIQLKHNRSFLETEYLKSSNGEIVDLTLTSVDLKLFLDHYDVYNLEYDGGWKFKSCQGAFCDYIDYWMEIKKTETGAKKELAKLMLNSLYGKFATNPRRVKKIPYLEDNTLHFYKDKEEIADPIYTPMACFITAYARYKTISTAQLMYDRFIYADTDSLHLEGWGPPDIDIHKAELGKWKHEGYYSRSKYLRAKTYMETMFIYYPDYIELKEKDRAKWTYNRVNNRYEKTTVTCAGMPDNVKLKVNYDNFTYGSTFTGKLRPAHVPGGVVLEEGPFTIDD